ncbi:MAG: putative glutamine amidotransferase [Oceanospirillaceae bacterium]|jgi:putative glutamine amidotransferase
MLLSITSVNRYPVLYMSKPLIGLVCEVSQDGLHPYHRVSEKYARAVVDGMGAVPVLIPALTNTDNQLDIDIEALLNHLDGVLLPGGYSNIEPHHYGETSRAGTQHDRARDSLALALIPAAIKQGVPLLAICRGFQEMNVAYGGSLHQHVQELAPYDDHRENKADTFEVQYGHSHSITLTNNGLLRQLYGKAEAQVNSLHGQGIHQVGQGLTVEALSEDGLVEAITDANSQTFNLAVQWHPEYQVTNDDLYQSIFSAFANACNGRLQNRGVR